MYFGPDVIPGDEVSDVDLRSTISLALIFLILVSSVSRSNTTRGRWGLLTFNLKVVGNRKVIGRFYEIMISK